MSLLADLLSKTKNAEPPGGKAVPPTLARAQGVGATSNWRKRRYIIMSVIAVAAVIIGIFLPSQLKRLSVLQPAKTVALPPQPLKMPLPPRISPAATPEQIVEDAQKVAAAGNQDKTTAPAPVSNKQTTSAACVKIPAIRPIAKAPRHTQQNIARNQGMIVQAKPVTGATKRVETAPRVIDTDARGALLYAARSSEQAGDWRGALASYRAALDIDPENYRIMSNSAAAYNKLGMFSDGEREARRALARKPDHVPSLINAAIACSSQGNNQGALKLFAAAAAAEPGNRSLAINLGIMQERTGNLDEALATYRRAAASGDPQALFGMGRVYDQKGNKNEAITAYRLIMAQKDASLALKQEVKNRMLRLEE